MVSPNMDRSPISTSVNLPLDGYSACQTLIGNAIRSCINGDSLSRVTIWIKKLENNGTSLLSSFQLSISDTGRGIPYEEIQSLYQCFISTYQTCFSSAPLFWGGQLQIMTTEYSEEVVRQYQVYDAFHNPRVMQLRSLPKESGHYSGTVVTLSFTGYPEKFLDYIHDICSKMEILMLKNIAIEVMIARFPEYDECSTNDVTCVSGGLLLPPELSNLERLAVGFTNHIAKSSNEESDLPKHFQRKPFKIGKAQSGSSQSSSETIWFFETCFVIIEAPAMYTTCDNSVKTQVFFFQDFMCATVTPTILEFLKTKVNWANFGLKVKKMQVDEYGVAFIEWDNLAQLESIAIVLHRYRNEFLYFMENKHQTKAVKWFREVNLLKKSVEDALNDLKHQHPHLFPSQHSLEMQKHVPYLSTCISRLISSSSDVHFKAACIEILDLQSSEFSVVESEIRSRLLHVLEDSDRFSSAERTSPFKCQGLKDKRGFQKGHLETKSHDSLEEDSEAEYSFEGTDIWEQP